MCRVNSKTPYGVEIDEMPDISRVYIFDIGGPHTYRTVYMDGRTHPTDLTRSYYGHSIGWSQGDTLVADPVGFNEGFWLDRRGLPSTEQPHTLKVGGQYEGAPPPTPFLP